MPRLPLILLLLLCRAGSAHARDIDFAHDVVPLLKKHCAECHTDGHSEGGFSFNSQRQIIASGYAKVPESGLSRIMELVTSVDQDDQMPPKDRPRLSSDDIQTLDRWIAAGTPWEPGFRFGSSGYEPPLLPRQVELPPLQKPDQNRIDRILSRYYEGREVPVPNKVRDQIFLRRAYMDLIGTPPTIEEQLDFLNAPSARRRTDLVDSLLARDHDYAEHWMTFWNDLLRNDYAGTGYIDGGRKQVTEWLYEALVSNKPYDQFVRELIAPTDASAGFINGIKWRGNVNASQVREIQFAQNVCQVFLGINMKCASCHDSFIDRWTLDEAYGMAAIYSTRALEVHRCDKPTGRIAEAAWIFPELGQVDPKAEQPERLKQLAVVLTSPQNGRFSRTIVNRLWHRLLGHGIVHPVDAMHTEPWNADLLDDLANALIEDQFDLKALLRLMVTSDAYQAEAVAAEDSATSGEFVFRGPLARHITAEQFMDSVWQLTETAPPAIDAPIPPSLYYGKSLPQTERTGKWIWSYADTGSSPAGEQAAFRMTLMLDQRPHRAEVVITCDNEYQLLVNGRRLGADTNWQTVERLDIRSALAPGDNDVMIIGKNAGSAPNPAGLYAEIILADQAGLKSRYATNETWLASREVPAGPDADSVTWSAAAAVEPQNFLGPAAEAAIRAELASAMNNVHRVPRASLLRSNLLMRSLGRPNREQVVTTRPPSLSTLQAIDLANGELLDQMLSKGAARLVDRGVAPKTLVAQLFQTAICRPPSEEEQHLLESFLGDTPTADRVQDLLWLLILMPEFQFIY